MNLLCLCSYNSLPNVGMLPRASVNHSNIISAVNKRLATQYMGNRYVHFVNLYDIFSERGKANERLFMPDHVHPSKDGYMKIIDAIVPYLDGEPIPKRYLRAREW